MDPIAHPLSAMSAKSKGSSSTATKKQQPTIPLYGNDGFGCKSTHARKSDSRRHNTSVSVSGKKPCPFDRCGYATGGVDKMNEHMRKMHDVPLSQTAESSRSPRPPQHHSGSETHDKVTSNQTFTPTNSSSSNTIFFYTPSYDNTMSVSNNNLSSQQHDDDVTLNHHQPVHSYSHTLHGIGDWAYDCDQTLSPYPAWDMPQTTTDVSGRKYDVPCLSLGSSTFMPPQFVAPTLGFHDDTINGCWE